MYTGKIRVLIDYHFNNNEGIEPIATKVINSPAEFWQFVKTIYPHNWRGDDGYTFEEWPDDAKPAKNFCSDYFYQAVTYLTPKHYFLAVATPEGKEGEK